MNYYSGFFLDHAELIDFFRLFMVSSSTPAFMHKVASLGSSKSLPDSATAGASADVMVEAELELVEERVESCWRG